LALAFITRFVSTFGQIAPTANGTNVANPPIIVPGIEQFIYQRVLVVAFSIPFLPDFNIKDAQAIAVWSFIPRSYVYETDKHKFRHLMKLVIYYKQS
jgi:hypothetical protein